MVAVKDILEAKGRQVWTISPDASVFDALALMAEKSIGALIVTRADEVVGILSERDYARKVVLEGRISRDTPVHAIMSTQVYFVQPETRAEECMVLMTDQRLRHLPVYQAGKLVGVISIGDIVKSIIAHQRITIEHLENYIMGKYPG
jgi:CBS domain-containing protein